MTTHPDPTGQRLAHALEALSAVQLQLDEERLRRQHAEALFDDLVEALADALILVDARGLVVRVNAAARQLLGRTAGELLEQPATGLFAEEVPTSPWTLLESAPCGALTVETTGLRPDGTSVPVSLSVAAVRDATGKVDGAVYAARDLSETHRLLHRVTAAEARWRLIVGVDDLFQGELDPGQALEAVVAHLQEATGFDAAVFLTDGPRVTEVVPGTPSGTLAAAGSLAVGRLPAGTALETAVGEVRTVHGRGVGQDFPALGSGPSAIRSFVAAPLAARDTVLGALVLASDTPEGITEGAAELAEQLAARIGLTLSSAHLRDSLTRYEAVVETNRLREEIVAGLSHDMKTPLSVLVGALESLTTRDQHFLEPATREELLAMMDRQARRLQRLVHQFLDYVRLQAGEPLVLKREPTDLAEVLDRVATTFRGKAPLAIDLAPGLPPVRVDADRFEQVVTNLVATAAGFSPRDQEVRVAARHVDTAVEVTVIDQGPGIAPEDLARIFDGGGGVGLEGTGLGLHVARTLVEAMGGDIRVDSRLGRGSRFTVSVPTAGARAGTGTHGTDAR